MSFRLSANACRAPFVYSWQLIRVFISFPLQLNFLHFCLRIACGRTPLGWNSAQVSRSRAGLYNAAGKLVTYKRCAKERNEHAFQFESLRNKLNSLENEPGQLLSCSPAIAPGMWASKETASKAAPGWPPSPPRQPGSVSTPSLSSPRERSPVLLPLSLPTSCPQQLLSQESVPISHWGPSHPHF